MDTSIFEISVLFLFLWTVSILSYLFGNPNPLWIAIVATGGAGIIILLAALLIFSLNFLHNRFRIFR